MIISSLWIAILTILKGLGKINLEVSEICMTGIVITAVWTPTFLSILADKFANKLGR